MVVIAELAPYDPQEMCSKCGAEGPAVTFHEVPTPDRASPCSARQQDLGEHLCLRCSRCGHTWIRAVIEEEQMGIRKYGAKDGEVTGVEETGAAGDDMGIRREAAQAEPWGEEDEAALAEENRDGEPAS